MPYSFVVETVDSADFRRNAFDFAALGGRKTPFIGEFDENRVSCSRYETAKSLILRMCFRRTGLVPGLGIRYDYGAVWNYRS
jgi:hypothetical protein